MKSSLEKIEKWLPEQVWLKRGKWYQTAVYAEIFNEGESTKYAELLGQPFKRSAVVWLPNGDYLDLKNEWDAMVACVREECRKDPAYLDKYSAHCMKLCEEFIAFSADIKKLDAKSLTNAELAKTYAGMVDKLKRFMPFMIGVHVVDEILTEGFDTLLKAFIKEQKLSQVDFFSYQTALAYPYRKIFVLQEKEDLLKIALELKKNNQTTESALARTLLEKHTDQYSWINSAALEHYPYTLNEFKVRLTDLMAIDLEAEYQSMVSNEAKIRHEQEVCMETIAKTTSGDELVHVSKTIQVFGFLRSYRIDATYIAYNNAMNIVSEINKRLGLDLMDFKYLDSGEVREALLDNMPYKRLIEERKKGLMSITLDGERFELTGADLDRFVPLVKQKEEKPQAAGTVKGSTAYPGKITGPCKVLFSLEDMKKVNKGDIIVISMTDPNYIPAMNKASAFVTDQGGILCHAAIVSREMKKPCIIGTKIATKSFKDNDVLEVDADNGVVRLLK
jgi:phosphohistidine swiveling domain-containing protein